MDAINVSLTAADGTAATYTEANINAIEALTTGTITATLDTSAKADLLDNTNGLQNLSRAHALTLSIADASISGAQLVALDAKTTVAIPVASTTVTGTYADIVAAYASSGITGLGNEAITPTGAITVAQANALNALTTGVVTATISDGTMALLTGLTLNLDSNGAQVVAANGSSSNAYTITPTDTSASADITTIGTTLSM